LYIALTFYESCYGNEGEEQLWYGRASSALPQICPYCENDEHYGRAAAAFTGHEWRLDVSNAWDVVQTGLESAGIDTASMKPEFHRIPQDMVQAAGIGRDLYVMAVPIPVSGKLSGVRYLCVETESITDAEVSEATVTHVKAGTDAQLTIEYTVGSDTRKGFVWLKK
jgi:hypothetical protein